MSMKTTILIAAHELRGGVIPKKGEPKQSITVTAGEELTPEKAKALGLDRNAIDDLLARGSLAEVSARVAAGEAGDEIAALREQLAAERQRAEDAEKALAAAATTT